MSVSMEEIPQNPENNVSTRILLALPDLIEKHGIDKLTIRQIAEAAGVNVAAVNYYFRSRDALLDQAMGVSWRHSQGDIVSIAQDGQTSPEDRLRRLTQYLVNGQRRYPRLTAAIINHPRLQVLPGLIALIRPLVHTLFDASEERLSDDEVDRRTSLFILGLLMPSLLPNLEQALPGCVQGQDGMVPPWIETLLSLYRSKA